MKKWAANVLVSKDWIPLSEEGRRAALNSGPDLWAGLKKLSCSFKYATFRENSVRFFESNCSKTHLARFHFHPADIVRLWCVLAPDSHAMIPDLDYHMWIWSENSSAKSQWVERFGWENEMIVERNNWRNKIMAERNNSWGETIGGEK
jgi:hypothetical protein